MKKAIVSLLKKSIITILTVCCVFSNIVNADTSTEYSCIEEYEEADGRYCIHGDHERAEVSTRAFVEGCDTRKQLITSALLSTVLNNPYCEVNFVGRYLENGSNTNPKKITPEELNLLSAASVKIVSLFQLSGTDVNDFTRVNGISHATQAVNCAAALGQPNGTPIYFCVDCLPSKLALNAYFGGINSILSNSSKNPNGYIMGVYGTAGTLKYLRTIYPNIRTMIWGGSVSIVDGETFYNWNIFQQSPHILIGSGANQMYIDVCNAFSQSYGAWLHTHSYQAWSNYGNSALHRRKCKYCTKYDYAAHIPNAAQTRCTVCGYTGDMSSTQGVGNSPDNGRFSLKPYINDSRRIKE